MQTAMRMVFYIYNSAPSSTVEDKLRDELCTFYIYTNDITNVVSYLSIYCSILSFYRSIVLSTYRSIHPSIRLCLLLTQYHVFKHTDMY